MGHLLVDGQKEDLYKSLDPRLPTFFPSLFFMINLIPFLPGGMKIGHIATIQLLVMNMKRSIKKFLNSSMKKIKQHKERIKEFKFSSFKEDFVITEQEEREGGFFGTLNFKNNLGLRIN